MSVVSACMTEKTFVDSATQIEDELQNELPPIICFNPRKKIIPNRIPATDIVRDGKADIVLRKCSQLVWAPPRKAMEPKPKYPINMSWSPEVVKFNIENEVVVRKLLISNRSSHSIYIHCCGLWGDTARLGAGWRCYPRTRFLLAPGLLGELFIHATPRDVSPVPCATAGLQLATANLRDLVVGYFSVPIDVTFGSFRENTLDECGE